jgi:hypothetical protein
LLGIGATCVASLYQHRRRPARRTCVPPRQSVIFIACTTAIHNLKVRANGQNSPF